jgi:hypothetical protein
MIVSFAHTHIPGLYMRGFDGMQTKSVALRVCVHAFVLQQRTRSTNLHDAEMRQVPGLYDNHLACALRRESDLVGRPRPRAFVKVLS